jgi:hypothetical protein
MENFSCGFFCLKVSPYSANFLIFGTITNLCGGISFFKSAYYVCEQLITQKKIRMKKIFMVAIATILIQTGFAQVNKGQWLVGGNTGFSSSKTGDYKTNTIEFSPNAGYFFVNNFAGGLRVNIQSVKEEVGDLDDKYSTTTVAPFVRYYFLPATQKVNVFADASYGFGSMKSDGSDSRSVSGFGIMAGPAIFLSPNTALEVTLGYNSMKMEDADDRTNTFQFGVGFQIHLGKGTK